MIYLVLTAADLILKLKKEPRCGFPIPSRINLAQRIVVPPRSNRGVKPENAKAFRGVIRDNTHSVADNQNQ